MICVNNGVSRAFADKRYVNITGDIMTGPLKINTSSTTALLVEDNGTKDNVFVVDTVNGRVGVNMAPTAYGLEVAKEGGQCVYLTDNGTSTFNLIKSTRAPYDWLWSSSLSVRHYIPENLFIYFDDGVGAGNGVIRFCPTASSIMSSSGSLILGGYNNTYNESLTFDFEPATDTQTVTISSTTGVTSGS